MSAIKKWLRPNVVIPLLLVGGLVFALLSLTNIGKVVALMVSFPPLDLLVFLTLMVAYEVVRGVQWIVLLRALRLKSSLRTELFAFSVSEVTKALPIGNYVQNYLLQESEQREDFGRTSAATTLIILLEVGVSLLGVLIFGDGSWTTILRILIVVGVALAALAFWLGLRYSQRHDPRSGCRSANSCARRWRSCTISPMVCATCCIHARWRSPLASARSTSSSPRLAYL